MDWIHVEQSLVIEGVPEEVNAVVSDYRVGHPAILPRQFAPLVVEQGGQGAGTIVRGSATVWGRAVPFHHKVTEPEPGRVLVETDIDTGQYTTFTFEPLAGGRQTRVTIAGEFPRSPGLLGILERLTTPSVVRGMYRSELQNLAAFVNKQADRSAR